VAKKTVRLATAIRPIRTGACGRSSASTVLTTNLLEAAIARRVSAAAIGSLYLQDVVFLNGSVASITTVLEDGTMIKSATIGREGLVGTEAVFGGNRSTGEAMMQVPDTDAEFLSISLFKAELKRKGPLFESAQRCAQALMKLMMQSTASMAAHPVQEHAAAGC
jgi:hypothetical protein